MLLLATTGLVNMHAKNINVTGIITDNFGNPVDGAIISIGKNTVTLTDHDGFFSCTIDENAEITINHPDSKKTTVPVDGQMEMKIVVDKEVTQLEEFVKTGKGKAGIQFPPTDLDIIGDTLVFRSKILTPHRYLSSGRRTIAQPVIINPKRKEIIYAKPLVYDGKRYAYTQERMYDFDKNLDPLSELTDIQIKKTSTRRDDTLRYEDKVVVSHPKDRYMLAVMLSIEDYNRIIYERTDTTAYGTKNPLRFLKHNLDGMIITDEHYHPRQNREPMPTQGNVDLTFKVGQAKLDPELGNNQKELESLISQLRTIEDDGDVQIKSISLIGYASPEGPYQSNLNLAQRRTRSAMDIISQHLASSTIKRAHLSTGANVQEWSMVEEMMRRDSLYEEADIIKGIIESNPGSIDRQSRAIVRLPFYDKIKDDYLPGLRTVAYNFVSQRFRFPTDEEIRAKYLSDPSKLSLYDYWRLYTVTEDLAEKETIAHKAFDKYHNDKRYNLLLANDLTAIMLQRGKSTAEYLEPILTEWEGKDDIPFEAYATLATVYLNEAKFGKADSIAALMPDGGKFHKHKIYAKALSGKYRDVLAEISQDSPINEVMMLLAVKSDRLALEKAEELGETAEEEYLKAIANWRNGADYEYDAFIHLQKAIDLDPSLEEVARDDGDLIDCIKMIDSYKEAEAAEEADTTEGGEE